MALVRLRHFQFRFGKMTNLPLDIVLWETVHLHSILELDHFIRFVSVSLRANFKKTSCCSGDQLSHQVTVNI